MTIHERNIEGGTFEAAANITPLLFEGEHLVRQTMIGDEIWFVAADICRALEIGNPTMAIARLDDDEKRICNLNTLNTNEGIAGNPNVSIVSEPGAYRLVFTSRKPVAERFKRWLAHEVIPAIRKTGGYNAEPEVTSIPEKDETSDNENVSLRHITECRQTFGTQAAGQLWFKLGLPVVPAMLQDPRQMTIFDYSAIKTPLAS